MASLLNSLRAHCINQLLTLGPLNNTHREYFVMDEKRDTCRVKVKMAASEKTQLYCNRFVRCNMGDLFVFHQLDVMFSFKSSMALQNIYLLNLI